MQIADNCQQFPAIIGKFYIYRQFFAYLLVHPLLLLLYSLVVDVFLVWHQLVDGTARCKLNDAV